mgnify:CR=1 FL=1
MQLQYNNQHNKGMPMYKAVLAGTLLTIFPMMSMEHTSNITKTYVDLAQIKSMCSQLHTQVLQGNFNPDVLVGITRGGIVPLGLLAGEHMFNNRNIRMISIASYEGMDKQKELKLLTSIHIDDYKGFKKILVIDDIVDTGDTIKHVLGLLNEYLPQAIIKSAALFYKKKSCMEPNYYVQETSDWIVFPWEE